MDRPFDPIASVTEEMNRPAPRRWEEARFDYTVESMPPPVLMWVNETPAVFKGGLHLIAGPKKCGKTTLSRILIAAILSNGEKVFGITAKTGLKVSLYDTEQADWRIFHQTERAFKMAQKERVRSSQLEVFHLKKFDFETRLRIITETVEDDHPDVIILDGVAQLLVDINNMEESGRIVDALNNLADTAAVLMVLHTNPSDPTGKARGNLGTLIENAVETAFLVRKENDIFTVECKESRGVEFTPFSYMKTGEDELVEAVTPVKEKTVSLKERLLATMEQGKVYTLNDLYNLFPDSKTASIRSAVDDLRLDGKVLKPDRGQYKLIPVIENVVEGPRL